MTNKVPLFTNMNPFPEPSLEAARDTRLSSKLEEFLENQLFFLHPVSPEVEHNVIISCKCREQTLSVSSLHPLLENCSSDIAPNYGFHLP